MRQNDKRQQNMRWSLLFLMSALLDCDARDITIFFNYGANSNSSEKSHYLICIGIVVETSSSQQQQQYIRIHIAHNKSWRDKKKKKSWHNLYKTRRNTLTVRNSQLVTSFFSLLYKTTTILYTRTTINININKYVYKRDEKRKNI